MASSAEEKLSHPAPSPGQDEDRSLAKRPRVASPSATDLSVKSETKPSSSQTKQPTALPPQDESGNQATLGEGKENDDRQAMLEKEKKDAECKAQLESDLEWLSDDHGKACLADYAREMPEIARRIRTMRREEEKKEERLWKKYKSYPQRVEELIYGVSNFPYLETQHLEQACDEIGDMLDDMRLDNARNYRSLEHKFRILETMLQIFEAVLEGAGNGESNQVCDHCDEEDSEIEWGWFFIEVFAFLTCDERKRLMARPTGQGRETWLQRLEGCIQATDNHPFLLQLRKAYGIMGKEKAWFEDEDYDSP
ncbi:hypothetical protein PG987_000246 [Apiospora arundinis]